MQNSLSSTIRIISILFFSLCQIQICYPQEYYEEITYPDTLDIVSMLPINHDTIIIGISTNNPYAYGCIYKSFDGGNTWEFAGLNQTHVYCFLEGVGDTIYAGTGYGIFTSGNYGDSWELILPMTENVVSMARLQQGKLFAGFGGGLCVPSIMA
ncbi:MAG: hypothetical protein M0Q51_13490 [Bacteroidales bacterium]|nr:hypothetical protein [Bacteroidales bacterium]